MKSPSQKEGHISPSDSHKLHSSSSRESMTVVPDETNLEAPRLILHLLETITTHR